MRTAQQHSQSRRIDGNGHTNDDRFTASHERITGNTWSHRFYIMIYETSNISQNMKLRSLYMHSLIARSTLICYSLCFYTIHDSEIPAEYILLVLHQI